MKMIMPDTIAEIVFQVKWNRTEARHTEESFIRINFWRDILPEALKEMMIGSCIGDRIELAVESGTWIPPYDPRKKLRLKRRQFDDTKISPKFGRFYPKGLLKDVATIFPENIEPFRCAGTDASEIIADFNHPLSGCNFHIIGTINDVLTKPYERGGESQLLTEYLTNGAGMQARYACTPTDFSSSDAFLREDSEADTEFYKKPRLVVHTDSHAIEVISGLYAKILHPGMDVLDLMSSWRSHLPESVALKSVVGLGLNKEEMADNPQLTEYLIHDMNQNPRLPFDDNRFDAVICTVSVEYMTSPFEVFAEVARILRPTGCFMLTFSNRWFPPKVISLWKELHEFERMGLVLDYFLRSGLYTDLETFSSRGFPRPETDKYYPEMRLGDPVYAVWGRKGA